jgi:hypothetical protein
LNIVVYNVRASQPSIGLDWESLGSWSTASFLVALPCGNLLGLVRREAPTRLVAILSANIELRILQDVSFAILGVGILELCFDVALG